MEHAGKTMMLVACLAACGQSNGVSTAGEPPAQDETSATEPAAAACIAHAEPAAESLTAPVDFAADVAPIFTKACAFSACHSSKGSSNHGLFLNAATPENIEAVKVSLRAKTQAAPSMAYVAPGDLPNSFVMHKLDGDQCTLAAQCAGGDCGKSMPSGNDLLPEESRDVIRRWIAQGAK